MKVVFDFCNTLRDDRGEDTVWPVREIYRALSDAGHELYVVTATKAPRSQWDRIKDTRLRWMRDAYLEEPVEMVVCGEEGKRPSFDRIGPDLVIDDSSHVIELARSMDIAALRC